MMPSRLGPYGLIAGTCVLANFFILVVGDHVGLHYVVSTSISFVVCVVLGYVLHSRFTFPAPIAWEAFARYTLAMSMNYPLSIIAVWFFHELLSLQMIFAAPAATLALTAYNFVSSRWAISHRTVIE
jgi:putative flippase GtrA